MVTAGEISKQFGIPRHALYRLVDAKKIPAREEPAPIWYTRKRRQLLFAPSEVAAALRALRDSREPYSP